MKLTNTFKSISITYNKLSTWGKVLLFVVIFLIVVVLFKPLKRIGVEGFEQNDAFMLKTGTDVYDDFYADMYDFLVFNNIKDDYEVGQIVNKTKATSESIILDVGSGTGHHVAKLGHAGFNVKGIDISPAMVNKAKELYPDYSFTVGNALNKSQFNPGSFTHIMCLYFTIYYFKDKSIFFNNAMDWLMPGGYLIVHIVDREQFDPILPPGNPLLLVSPQRYAKERITNTKVIFNDMEYASNFELDTSTNQAKFVEKFKHKENGKTRKNEHTLYMETEQDVVTKAQNAGFIIQAKIDLVKCQYEYQYLYIFMKPN